MSSKMSRELKRLQAFNAVAIPKPKQLVLPPTPPPSHVSSSKEVSPTKASSDDDDNDVTLGQVASASANKSCTSGKISAPKIGISKNSLVGAKKASSKKRKLPTSSAPPPRTAVAPGTCHHSTSVAAPSAQDPLLASVVTAGPLPSDPQLGWRIEVMVPRLGAVWWAATVTGWHGGRHECWFDVGVASYQDLRRPEAGGNSDGAQWRRSNSIDASQGADEGDEHESDEEAEDETETDHGSKKKAGKEAAGSKSSGNDLDLSHAPLQWQRALKRDGYLVVKGVLPRSQCSAYLDGMWAFVTSLNPHIHRKRPETWYPPLNEEIGAGDSATADDGEATAGEIEGDLRGTGETAAGADDARSSTAPQPGNSGASAAKHATANSKASMSGGGGGQKNGDGGGWDEDPWPESGRGLFQEHGAG